MFRVNGETWNIAFVNPDSKLLQRLNGTYTVGMTDDETKTIYLSNQLNGEFLRKVLTHEITHCYMYSYDIYLDEMQEEVICDILATYARDIIKITDEVYKQFNGES